MKKIALSVLAILFFILVAAQSSTAQEKYTLKSAYPPGRYEMVTDIDMDMTMDMGGAKMPMKQKQTQYITIDAAERSSDGTQKIVQEITRIAMSGKMMMIDTKYDSADPDAEKSPMKMMGAMVGMKLTMTFDKDGKMIKMEGIDEFFEKLSKHPDYPKQVTEMLEKQMTDESLTKSFDVMREMMPKTPVGIGETWKTEGSSEMPILGKIKTNLENTLKEIKTENGRKLAVIVSKSILRSEEPKEIENMGIKMTFVKMDMSGETAALVDLESGLLQKSVSDITMAMELEADAGGKAMTQKMTGTTKTTVTVLRIPPPPVVSVIN